MASKKKGNKKNWLTLFSEIINLVSLPVIAGALVFLYHQFSSLKDQQISSLDAKIELLEGSQITEAWDKYNATKNFYKEEVERSKVLSAQTDSLEYKLTQFRNDNAFVLDSVQVEEIYKGLKGYERLKESVKYYENALNSSQDLIKARGQQILKMDSMIKLQAKIIELAEFRLKIYEKYSDLK